MPRSIAGSFLVKQLLLIANLINSYSKKVDSKVWVEFDEALKSSEVRLRGAHRARR